VHVRERFRPYCVSQKENKFTIYGSFNLKMESQEVKCRKDNYNHNIVVIQWVFVMAGVLYDYGRQNGWQWGQVAKRGVAYLIITPPSLIMENEASDVKALEGWCPLLVAKCRVAQVTRRTSRVCAKD
jgi:hypothetical protein